MKKFIAIIMAVIMVMSFATVAFAADGFTDVSKSKYETAINELYDLGIVNGYSKTKFGTNYTLTRAEACAIIVRALYGEKKVQNVINFTDVSYKDWFYEYVNTAVFYDVMHGHNTTTFAPNADITYDQFATLILNALGYNAPRLAGAWPENVERIASRLGLYDGISYYTVGSEFITRGEACQMLYNALDCYIVEYQGSRIVETSKTLYEAMGFTYEPEYLYVNGTITDIVDVSNYYRRSTNCYYLATINNTVYFIATTYTLNEKDYVEIYTTKDTNIYDEYVWYVSYLVKAIQPIEPTTPNVIGTVTYVGETHEIAGYNLCEIEVKADDGSLKTYFVNVKTFKGDVSIGDIISLKKVKTLTLDGETLDIYEAELHLTF